MMEVWIRAIAENIHKLEYKIQDLEKQLKNNQEYCDRLDSKLSDLFTCVDENEEDANHKIHRLQVMQDAQQEYLDSIEESVTHAEELIERITNGREH